MTHTNPGRNANAVTRAPAATAGTTMPPSVPTVFVEHVEEAAAFYQGLGFSLERSQPGSPHAPAWATLRLGSATLRVEENPAGHPPGGPTNHGPFVGFTAFVATLEEVVDAAASLGCEPTVVSGTGAGPAYTFCDPYGVQWTFAATPGTGVPVRDATAWAH